MGNQQWAMKEFEVLRNELNDRISFLHRTINLAMVFWFVSVIALFCFISCGLSYDLLITFVLMVTIAIDLLAFNYQSNQNSLESIAKYIYEVVRPRVIETTGQDILEWEMYFAVQKRPFRYESALKVFPFVLPSLIPVSLLVLKVPMDRLQMALAWVNVVFLFIMIENFRYKLRRVK